MYVPKTYNFNHDEHMSRQKETGVKVHCGFGALHVPKYIKVREVIPKENKKLEISADLYIKI